MNDVATSPKATPSATRQTRANTAAHPNTTARPELPRRAIELPTKHKSDTTSMVYQVIMGAAACLALIGVIQQAKQRDAASTTSTDAPPPAVFVHTD